MANNESLPFLYTLFSAQTDLGATPPPDLSELESVISIRAEWEEKRWFFGPKRRQHTETWYVTADANTYDLVANLLPESPRTRPNGKSPQHVDLDSLSHYFTVHTEPILGRDSNRVKVIRWSDGNLMPWNETNLVHGLLAGSGKTGIELKPDNTHLSLGLMQVIFNCACGLRFSRILFPCYKQYKRASSDWQWHHGHWMNGRAENWWNADKAVAVARKALYTQIWQGKVVWRMRSTTEMKVPLRLDGWNLESSK
jgi:hypothetical protein